MQPSKQDETRVWTVAQVLKWTQGRFASAGLPTARLDAEVLLAGSLGWPRMSLYTKYDHVLDGEELGRFRDLIRRRLAGESVAYLMGHKEFWSLSLRVSPAVLVPRPDTETLVAAALLLLDGEEPAAATTGELTVHYDEPTEEELPEGAEGDEGEAAEGEAVLTATAQVTGAAAAPSEAGVPAATAGTEAGAAAPMAQATGPLIADIGTGSGAVALALKKERPAARVIAVDVSAEALAVARDNAARLGLAVELLEGDLLAPLASCGAFTLIVSNPPYIPTGDLAGLPAEVRGEPRLALDGGPDGLAIIRRLVQGARERLLPGGALCLEVGDGQAAAVGALLRGAGYVAVSERADLSGTARVVYGRRPA